MVLGWGGIETTCHPALPSTHHRVYIESELDKNLMLSRWKSPLILAEKLLAEGTIRGRCTTAQTLLETLTQGWGWRSAFSPAPAPPRPVPPVSSEQQEPAKRPSPVRPVPLREGGGLTVFI